MITKPVETQPSFEDLVRNHQVTVWRYLRSLGCDASLADDLTQETFLTLVRKPMEYRGEAAAASYLRMVAKSRFISLMRKEGREPNRVALESIDQAWVAIVREDGHDNGDEALLALQSCVTRLPQDAKKAIELRYADKASRKDIGATLDLSEDGVKSLLRRSRKALRLCIEKKLSSESYRASNFETPEW